MSFETYFLQKLPRVLRINLQVYNRDGKP